MSSHLVGRVNWQHFAEVCKNNHTNHISFHSGDCNMIHIINKKEELKLRNHTYLHNMVCKKDNCSTTCIKPFNRHTNSTKLNMKLMNINNQTETNLLYFMDQLIEQIKDFSNVQKIKMENERKQLITKSKLPKKLFLKKELTDQIDLNFVNKYTRNPTDDDILDFYGNINNFNYRDYEGDKRCNFNETTIYEQSQIIQCIILEGRIDLIQMFIDHNIKFDEYIIVKDNYYSIFGIDYLAYCIFKNYIELNLINITQDFTYLESLEMRYYELRNYLDIVKTTIVDNTTLNIAIKQHFDILVLIQTIVGDKISYDKKFKYYIHNKLKIGENVDAY
jgi:hypothetical protein